MRSRRITDGNRLSDITTDWWVKQPQFQTLAANKGLDVRSSLWMNWLSGRFPGAQIVPAESYSHGISGASRDKQRLEPYFPVELKTRLIEALQKAYTELCTPPLDMRTGLPRKDWKPTVPQNIDWSKFFGTSGYGDHDEIRSALSNQRRSNTENSECEYLTVGLIGALLVHISSL